MKTEIITTTLRRVRACHPCKEGWEMLLAHLGKKSADDEPLPFAVILKSNGLDDALWCLRAEPQNSRQWRLFAVKCARRVQHLMTDPRSIAALDVAERHANGLATDNELSAARAAARAALRLAAWDAALAAALDTARAAEWAAARDATLDVARAAAWAAARDVSLSVVWDAVRAAAWDAAWDATRDAMAADFLAMVSE